MFGLKYALFYVDEKTKFDNFVETINIFNPFIFLFFYGTLLFFCYQFYTIKSVIYARDDKIDELDGYEFVL